MKPSDIALVNLPSDPRFDPSGSRIAFVVSTPDVDHDRYTRVIWISDQNGVRRFTAGPGDSAPRWSPDGSHLAFLRSVDGKPAQVAVMPVNGGEPRIVSDFEFGASGLEWSPDGSRIAVNATTPTEEWSGLDEDERKRRPRRVKWMPYRFDTLGAMDDRSRQVWLVDPTGEEDPRNLTPGEFDASFHDWSPDGTRLVVISDREPQRGLLAGVNVYEVDLGSGELSQVGDRGHWGVASYRPDGALHLIGAPSPAYPDLTTLHRVEADGTLTDLTRHLDRSSASLAAGPPFIRWEGDTAVVALEDSGRTSLIKVSPTGEVEAVVDGDRAVTGADSREGRVVFTDSSSVSPGELHLIDGGETATLTALNTVDLGLVTPSHFRAGPEEIDTWVFMPEGDGPVPLLLNIHGGPASQYGFGFFDEFQIYVSAGFGVVACNPRGSSGRGREFLRAVVGDGWGTVDLEDIDTAVTEALERFPRLDPNRMGIMGGSYGGFMTSWTIAFQSRWKSAVVERALTNFTSFAGTSDIGPTFPYMYTDADYPDAWKVWWEKSPLAYAHQVSTPTLVLHSENDFRCPIEQGEQYFTALLRNGTSTEMVRFPGESHELTRSGKPKHRVERFEAILDWHQRYLTD